MTETKTWNHNFELLLCLFCLFSTHLLSQVLERPLQSASVKLQRRGQQLLREPKDQRLQLGDAGQHLSGSGALARGKGAGATHEDRRGAIVGVWFNSSLNTSDMNGISHYGIKNRVDRAEHPGFEQRNLTYLSVLLVCLLRTLPSPPCLKAWWWSAGAPNVMTSYQTPGESHGHV